MLNKEQGRQLHQRMDIAFEASRIAAELADENLAVHVKDAISWQDLGRAREGSPLVEIECRLKDQFANFDQQVLDVVMDAVAVAVEREAAVRYCSKIPGFSRVRESAASAN